MTLRAGKLVLDGKVPGFFGIRLQGISKLTFRRGLQQCRRGGRLLKSTQGSPKLRTYANTNVQDSTLKADRIISGVCNSASSIIHDILRLGRKPHTNLFNASSHQRSALGDPSVSVAPRNASGGSSYHPAVLRTAQNWCSLSGFLHNPKKTQIGNIGIQRTFSTTAKLNANGKKDGKECKKKGGSLPCLKPVGLGADEKAKKGDNKVCEKFCMPCCAPARDPPTCVVAQKKRECKKFRPPRPAYSECKKDAMKPIKPCECLIQRLPPCGRDAQSSSFKNC